MDTKALEKFCPWAREELIDAVKLRCVRFALDDAGRAEYTRDAEAVKGTVLTSEERNQRIRLFDRIEEEGYDAFCEQAAYSWFNRFAAIRFMELRGYLPCGVRVLSGNDGTFNPECLKVAADLDLPGLTAEEAASLIVAGDDEALFRRIVVAQCNELAQCMPAIFAHVNDADALTLPDNLLREGEHNVVFHLVTDIPESDWEDVETLGWMYQFYNAERKAEFFASKRKAAPEDLAPATQLFTPDWIVRYMAENSLGRLWMLNHPESQLAEGMEYFIKPDKEHEDFIHVTSPEDITVCDPACGSGHILSYAFDLLFHMYEERGYREREIPSLILEKNLYGMEIDPRAAQIASLVLTMRAREHDRRFFSRGVVPHITVLESIEFEEGEVPQAIAERKGLADTLAHLGEIGSLFAPEEADVAAIETALGECAGDDLFAASLRGKLEHAHELCRPLMRTYDVAIANPPYMGSSSFNPFMSKWVKKHYPDSCKDLCTAFIERGYSLVGQQGYSAMVTMQSWMFLGSFEKMRTRIIDEKTILSMAHLGTRAFDAIGGEVVSVTTDVLYNSKADMQGSYVRLVDTVGSEPKRNKFIEAIQNPDCGWFYRADATTFHDIPGSPIAYWASEAMHRAFADGKSLCKEASLAQGLKCGDTDRFIRTWQEVSSDNILPPVKSASSSCKWHFLQNGGDYRKWYGNNSDVVDWEDNGYEIKNYRTPEGKLRSRVQNERLYHIDDCLTWSALTSGPISLRACQSNSICGGAGYFFVPKNSTRCSEFLALLNSSTASALKALLSPTLNNEVGDLKRIPVKLATTNREVERLAADCIALSKTDWDSQETSWDFKRSGLI